MSEWWMAACWLKERYDHGDSTCFLLWEPLTFHRSGWKEHLTVDKSEEEDTAWVIKSSVPERPPEGSVDRMVSFPREGILESIVVFSD